VVTAGEDLASGKAWSGFCAALAEAASDLARPTAPGTPIDLAEGHRYLTHMVRSAFELIVEGGDPRFPRLTPSLHETLKLGWDNPDNLHLNAHIRGAYDYRLWGSRGDAHYASIAVYGGSYARGGGSTVAYVELDDLELGPDGGFDVILSAREHPGNWVRLDDETTTLMIRQTFWDRSSETPGVFRIERVGAEGPPPPLSTEFMEAALRRAARYIRGTNRIFFDFADRWRECPNTFVPGDEERQAALQGIPGNRMVYGWWKLGPEEAAVIDFTPPACRYWGFALSNYWGQSFDDRSRPVHTNARRARARGDGSIRLVVAHRDPGLADANWMDTAGHAEGVWNFRWLLADEPLIPDPRIVAWSDLQGGRPQAADAQRPEGERSAGARARAISEREGPATSQGGRLESRPTRSEANRAFGSGEPNAAPEPEGER
jgi:hypothetical protein